MEYTEDEKIEIAHSTHAGMLHDDERHQKYHQALQLTVKDLKKENCTSIHALDIGCGTGILSMMAASSGCRHVSACESFEPMSEIAKEVIKMNGLDDKISVIGKASTDVLIPQDMDSKADLLVTEIFDSELFGEGVIPTLRDAHDRLLKPQCKVIPSSATIYVQLIQSEQLWQTNKIDFEVLGIRTPKVFKNCSGFTSGHELQVNQLYPCQMKLLSDVTEQTNISFMKPFYHDAKKLSKYSSSHRYITISRPGVLHGVLFWWDLVLHKDGNIVLSMEPKWVKQNDNDHQEVVWREHWMPVIYYVSQPIDVCTGDIISLTMYHDDYSVWFNVCKETKQIDVVENLDLKLSDKRFVERPYCDCGLHVHSSREKFSMLNDRDVHQYFNDAVLRYHKYKNSTLTVVGDMSILPLIFFKHGFKNIRYIECNPYSKDVMRNIYSSNNCFEGINMLDLHCIDLHNIGSKVFIFEPYLPTSLLPWQNLRIWKLMNKVRIMNADKDIKCYPSKAFLKGCLVDFKDLWRIREPVKQIDVFDLTVYDSVVKSVQSPLEIDGLGGFQAVEPFLMWEYEHKITSDIFVLKEFSLSQQPYEDVISFNGQVRVMQLNSETESSFNAVVLWMDFQDHKSSLEFCTGLNKENKWVKYSKQGIYFLGDQNFQDGKMTLDYNLLFQPDDCEILFSLLETD